MSDLREFATSEISRTNQMLVVEPLEPTFMEILKRESRRWPKPWFRMEHCPSVSYMLRCSGGPPDKMWSWGAWSPQMARLSLHCKPFYFQVRLPAYTIWHNKLGTFGQPRVWPECLRYCGSSIWDDVLYGPDGAKEMRYQLEELTIKMDALYQQLHAATLDADVQAKEELRYQLQDSTIKIAALSEQFHIATRDADGAKEELGHQLEESTMKIAALLHTATNDADGAKEELLHQLEESSIKIAAVHDRLLEQLHAATRDADGAKEELEEESTIVGSDVKDNEGGTGGVENPGGSGGTTGRKRRRQSGPA